ncbi:MAG TPA: hypothetical protein VFJ98_09750 [Mycobacteriales bacterium]|nr:hypothetical protein [Mycobacteriales bacterium]
MDEPRGRALPRRTAALLAAVPLVAVLLADATLVARHTTTEQVHRLPAHAATGRSPQAGRAIDAARTRTLALRALLARRGHAVLHHDRAEWLATVDPARPAFRRQQAATFDNMRDVPFSSWRYTFDPAHAQLHYADVPRYRVPYWAPETFALHYQLRGFDKEPTNLPQYPTFVRRAGRWYLTSLTDFAQEGMTSSRELWDYGPVAVVRRPRVLVLGHPSASSTMQVLAGEAEADIPRVTAVWGSHWSQRIVLLVPSTQRELARVVDDFGDLDHIAAVATAEVQTHSGHPDPVGDRVGINPDNWPKLSPLGRQIVLAHEFTHVATRAVTGGAMPTWLAEGFADYVGYLDSGVPTAFAAQELATDVRAGHVPRRLPPDEQFDGASKRLAQAYEAAWMACRLIASRYGQGALVRLYRAVGTSTDNSKVAVDEAMARVLHISTTRFVREWRDFLRGELS